MIYDVNVGNHFHFLDEESGKLFDLGDEHIEVRAKSAVPDGYTLDSVEVVLRGHKTKR